MIVGTKSTTAMVVLAQFMFLAGCSEKQTPLEVVNPEELGDSHTIAIGGDFILGRKFNLACYSKDKLSKVFNDLKPRMKNAELTILNAEGVISSGGSFSNKKEGGPYMYRAHPNAIHAIVEAGVDVVSVGNNHSGDYGPLAFTEMLDRLTRAGIGYFGGGENIKDAKRPAYRKVGDLTIAFVGGDLTMNRQFAATKNKAGTLFFFDVASGDNEDDVVEEFSKILREAKQYAHVVLFSPHWGDNWKDKPSDAIKNMAHRLIDEGYDGIFGHSSHRAQGVEIYRGRPIVYDMGNTLLDWGNIGYHEHSFFFELSVNRAGVSSMRAYPLKLQTNRTSLSKGKRKEDALKMIKDLSYEMGTKVVIKDGTARIGLSPGDIDLPTKPLVLRHKRPVRKAPSDVILDTLPSDAVVLNLEYTSGISLVGYRLLVEKMRAPSGAQIVQLFFSTKKKLEMDYKVHLEARGLDAKTGKPATKYAGHIPGDWLLPTSQWPLGKIIQDWTVFKMKLKPEGKVQFYAGLWDGKQLLDDKLTHLGEASFSRKAKLILDALDDYRLRR
jgi:poly-gamma-glutamate capsule biosynthesis protein CapA/YwtB (metallophosphatase superfamily)